MEANGFYFRAMFQNYSTLVNLASSEHTKLIRPKIKLRYQLSYGEGKVWSKSRLIYFIYDENLEKGTVIELINWVASTLRRLSRVKVAQGLIKARGPQVVGGRHIRPLGIGWVRLGRFG